MHDACLFGYNRHKHVYTLCLPYPGTRHWLQSATDHPRRPMLSSRTERTIPSLERCATRSSTTAPSSIRTISYRSNTRCSGESLSTTRRSWPRRKNMAYPGRPTTRPGRTSRRRALPGSYRESPDHVAPTRSTTTFLLFCGRVRAQGNRFAPGHWQRTRYRAPSPDDRAHIKKNGSVDVAAADISAPSSTVIEQYEALRSGALGEDIPVSARQGLVVLLRHGMWKWAQMMTAPPRPCPGHIAELSDIRPTHRDCSDLVHLLATIVTSLPERKVP
jgi:hypothetical protein